MNEICILEAWVHISQAITGLVDFKFKAKTGQSAPKRIKCQKKIISKKLKTNSRLKSCVNCLYTFYL